MNKKRLTAGAAAVCLSLTLCLPISAAGGGASLEEASQVVSALGILAGERHKLFSAPEVGELLDGLWAQKDELDHAVRRQVEELRRSYDQLRRIPADEYMEYAMLTNEASDVWHRAKEQSDFELFRPVLEKLVAFNIKFAGYYQGPL